MTLTQNDLQAIGSLIDQKLDKKLEPIEKKLGGIEKEVKKIKQDTTYIINALDKELMRDAKRVDRVERQLNLPPLAD